MGLSLTLWPALGILFLLQSCLIQALHEGLCLVLLWLVMLCLVNILGRSEVYSSSEKWRRSGIEGEWEKWEDWEKRREG